MAGDQHFSLEGKILSDWHTVWDAFILWSGYVILAAPDQRSEAAPRPLSGPGFLSVPPLRRIMSLLFSRRADSDWLWQWGPRCFQSSLFSASGTTSEEGTRVQPHSMGTYHISTKARSFSHCCRDGFSKLHPLLTVFFFQKLWELLGNISMEGEQDASKHGAHCCVKSSMVKFRELLEFLMPWIV